MEGVVHMDISCSALGKPRLSALVETVMVLEFLDMPKTGVLHKGHGHGHGVYIYVCVCVCSCMCVRYVCMYVHVLCV